MISRIGRPEIGLEAAGVNLTDTWVLLNEPEAWTRVRSKDELIDVIDAICNRVIPGTFYSFSQPIELRFNELLSGVRADLGIGIFGDDLDVLQQKADAIAAVLRSIPGSTGVKAQALGACRSSGSRSIATGSRARDRRRECARRGRGPGRQGRRPGRRGAARFALQVRFGARIATTSRRSGPSRSPIRKGG